MRAQVIDDCIKRLAVVQEHLRHAGMDQALQHVSTAISELKLAFPGLEKRKVSPARAEQAREGSDGYSGDQG